MVYEFKKTLKKVLYGLVYVFISGVLYLATDRPEAIGLIPILAGLQNWLKHCIGWDWL